jgi:hypothetical protein
MSIHVVPIVGMAFRPPANDVIMLLPTGAKLTLIREPDNPHDIDAIKVLLDDFNENGPHAHLLESLGEMLEADTYGHLKWNVDNLTDPFFLGYVANSPKTGGKFASEICNLLPPDVPISATLTFSASGRPQAQFDILTDDPNEFVSMDEDAAERDSQSEY